MYNPFKRTVVPVEGPSRVHQVEVAGGRGLDPLTAVLSRFRRRPTSHVAREQVPKRGMWVVYDGETYILTNLEPLDVATVHKILPDGTSLSGPDGRSIEFHVPANALTQAAWEDIPESRRPHLGVAAAFGYHQRGTF